MRPINRGHRILLAERFQGDPGELHLVVEQGIFDGDLRAGCGGLYKLGEEEGPLLEPDLTGMLGEVGSRGDVGLAAGTA